MPVPELRGRIYRAKFVPANRRQRVGDLGWHFVGHGEKGLGAWAIPASFFLVLTFNGNRYTIYNMSTISESSKSRKGKQRLFSQAGMIAVADARNKGLPITYAAEDRIVREYPDGTIEVLGTIENAPMPALPRKFSIGC